MKQIVKTILKAVVFTMLFVGITLSNALLFAYIFIDVEWIIFSLFVSLFEIILFIGYVFPIIFKDYITEFYKKEKLKNV